jgi:hypothetical protein
VPTHDRAADEFASFRERFMRASYWRAARIEARKSAENEEICDVAEGAAATLSSRLRAPGKNHVFCQPQKRLAHSAENAPTATWLAKTTLFASRQKRRLAQFR